MIIGYDCKSIDRAFLGNLKQQGGSQCNLQFQAMKLTKEEGEKGTVRHKMSTQKGDSGAPLILQLSEI